MRYIVAGDREFYIEPSLDFDCWPCALVYRGAHRRYPWDISESIAEHDLDLCDCLRTKNHRFYDIDSEGTDGTSLLLRSHLVDTDVQAQIPNHFISGENAVWISFEDPLRLNNKPEHWTFTVDTKQFVPAS
jgi:hypothetical protein